MDVQFCHKCITDLFFTYCPTVSLLLSQNRRQELQAMHETPFRFRDRAVPSASNMQKVPDNTYTYH